MVAPISRLRMDSARVARHHAMLPSSNRSRRLDSLPPETLSQIASYLDTCSKSFLMRVSLYLHAVTAKELYRNLDLDSSDSTRMCLATLAIQDETCGVVYALLVRSIRYVVDDEYIGLYRTPLLGFCGAITQMTGLQSLSISLPFSEPVWNVVDQRLIPSVVRRQPTALECVSIVDECDFTPWSLPFLKTLSLRYPSRIINLVSLRNITTIQISNHLDRTTLNYFLEALREGNHITPLYHLSLRIQENINIEMAIAAIALRASSLVTLAISRPVGSYRVSERTSDFIRT